MSRLPCTGRQKVQTPTQRSLQVTAFPLKEVDLEDISTGERTASLRAVEEADDLEDQIVVPDLAPGDFVEIRRGGKTYVGCLAKIPEYDTFGAEYRTILYNGHFLLHRAGDVTFQAPGWAYSSVVQKPISNSFATAGLSPESAALLAAAGIPTTTIAHIENFREAAETYAYTMRQRFAAAYRIFGEQKKVRSVTVDSVARWVFYADGDGEPTPAELYATYNFLLRNVRLYKPVKPRHMRTDREFILRSPAESERILWMWDQVRAAGASGEQKKTNELREFLGKTRRLVEWHRDSKRDLETASKQRPAVAFTDTDHTFIAALKDAALEPDVFPNPYRQVALGGILKALYPLYGNKPGSREAMQILKEIGIWTPWENTSMYQASEKGQMVTLEGHGLSTYADDVAQQAQLLGKQMLVREFQFDDEGKLRVEESNGKASANEGLNQDVLNLVKSRIVAPTDPTEKSFYATDPCAHIRRDFGNLPVYVIDDPTAHELDDGMSVEETPDGLWVHVHIADPTAYIPPSHPLSLTAQLRGNSVYLPERHYPMMPDFLSNERFNLGISQCAMTFSARVGENGELLDCDVRPSIVRNVKIIHYDDVDEVLDWSNVYGVQLQDHQRTPWVRQVLAERNAKLGDSAKDAIQNGVEDLRKLQKTMERAFRSRIQHGGFLSDQPEFRIGLEPYPQPFTPLHPTEPYYPRNETWPTINLSVHGAGHLSPSHLMVAECMILAGRIAAKWCTENGVPAMYRGQPNLLDHVRSKNLPLHTAEKVLSNVLQTQDPTSGVIPFGEFRKLLPYMPGAVMDVAPVAHYSMGIPGVGSSAGYVKVTSPLRRYKDMVVHWNMKAHMLKEKLPFNVDAVGRIAERMLDIENRTKVLNDRTDRFWACEWIRRREVLARRGERDKADGWKMPYVDFREQIDDRQYNALSGSEGDVYNALVTGIDTRSGAMWVILTDLGGVTANVAIGRGVGLTPGSGSPDLVGKEVKVRVERVDPQRGNISVRVVEG
ncbi:hypothetical protein SpCBS45565_g01305 [Spizellomyces sp. 'palustris']|nr:hypothetical protein SpCBS45565_g01305 [Spizellomyces sp. 'palustris']